MNLGVYGRAIPLLFLLAGMFGTIAVLLSWFILRFIPVPLALLSSLVAATWTVGRVFGRPGALLVPFAASLGVGLAAPVVMRSSEIAVREAVIPSDRQEAGLALHANEGWTHIQHIPLLMAAIGVGAVFGVIVVVVFRERQVWLAKGSRVLMFSIWIAMAVLVAWGMVRCASHPGVVERLTAVEFLLRIPAPGVCPHGQRYCAPGKLERRTTPIDDVVLIQDCKNRGCDLWFHTKENTGDPSERDLDHLPGQPWNADLRVYRDRRSGVLFVQIEQAETVAVFDPSLPGFLPRDSPSPLLRGTSPPLSWIVTALVGLLAMLGVWLHGRVGTSPANLTVNENRPPDEGARTPREDMALTPELLRHVSRAMLAVAIGLVAGAPLVAAWKVGLLG
ncbi:MAG: hypothetical protein IPK82_43960 [Polyangiaceae bacterium]|nr:hypothetical protein [Polyangiaceae bacterium]